MKFASILATCCIAATATFAAGQNVAYTEYLGAIKTAPSPLPLAADADGRLFYGTFNGASSELRVIQDPESMIGSANEAGTTISVFPMFPTGRGLQSIEVNSDGNLFVAGDTGNADVGNLWRFNRSGSGSTATYAEDTAFTQAVTDNSPARRSGVAILNDAGSNTGLLASNGFHNIHFFDFNGALVGTPLNNGNQNYMREMQFNSTDNVIYPLRNSGTLRLIMYYWENVNTTTGAADFVEEELISVGATNGASGSAAQNGYYYEDQHQLITLDGNVVISTVSQQPNIRVWDVLDNGTSLSLAYKISETDEGTTVTGLGDAVVLNDKLYVDSTTSSSIFVYGPAPAAVNRWNEYESRK